MMVYGVQSPGSASRLSKQTHTHTLWKWNINVIFDWVKTRQMLTVERFSSFCSSSALSGGGEFLSARGSEDSWTGGASLPAPVCPQPAGSVPAGRSLLSHLLCRQNIPEEGETFMLVLSQCVLALSGLVDLCPHLTVFLRVRTTGWSAWSWSTSLPSPSPLSTWSCLTFSERSLLLRTILLPCRSMPRLWGKVHTEINTVGHKDNRQTNTHTSARVHPVFSSGASSWSWPRLGSTYISSSQLQSLIKWVNRFMSHGHWPDPWF